MAVHDSQPQQAAEGKGNDPLVVVDDLYKVFGRDPERALALADEGQTRDAIFEATGMTVAVQGASFDVKPGEIFVVMGLSGSGKSTLLRLINRLIEPTRGRVLIGGREITSLSRKDLIDIRRREMSMVFQSFALMAHLKVWENAAFGLGITGVRERDRRQRAMVALEKVGLAPHAELYPDQLSGGMQQRVGLARALAVEPSLMLMDEAFSALDPLIRAEMQDLLLELQRREARTIIFISHDLDEAMRIGSRIAIMHQGRVLQVGTPEEILQNPADEHVRSFFRGVDATNVYSARDLARREAAVIVVHEREQPQAVLDRMRERGKTVVHVLTRNDRFVGVTTLETLRKAVSSHASDLESALIELEPIPATASFAETTERMARASFPLPVTSENGHYLGAISKTILLETLVRLEVP